MDTKWKVLGAALMCALAGHAPTATGPAGTRPARPQGPCDLYNAGGTPCVAAHSTTRALSAAYDGALYQVTRVSDGKTVDIGVVQTATSPVPDAGGYADAASQDRFCAHDLCVISVIYDQSGQGNHLRQAPPGPLFPGPAKGMFDTQPIADMAPVTIGGHKVYGVFMMPGMGFRNNDAKGLAIDDEPEGIYYVVDGTHYDSGCCFDYGNASTNGRAVGTGTMETTYFGTSTNWGRGSGTGPWIMADMEAGLFSGYDAKLNEGSPTIDAWRFVTAVVNGGGGNRWELRGGDAQQGPLKTFYSGVRPGSLTNNAYHPMHKQGAILLGIGGDNGNGSAGTFYEGVMTAGYPAPEVVDAVQANVVSAKYDVPRVTLSRLLTFSPAKTREVTASFTNTTGVPVGRVTFALTVPKGWRYEAADVRRMGDGVVAPGVTVIQRFVITAPPSPAAGIVIARVSWIETTTGRAASDAATQRVRSAHPVTINEVRLGTASSPSDQFIELYNASTAAVDMAGWTLDHTPSGWAPVRLTTIPAGTTLGPGAFYLLGAAPSGLAAPARPGDTTIRVRTTEGMVAGQSLVLGGESRTIVAVGTAAAPPTTVFAPVSTGPWIMVPQGSTNLPVVDVTGFEVGQPIAIDTGGRDEYATLTAVGKPATQTTLALAAVAGATNIKVGATANMTAGDTLTIGTGARKETVTVVRAGTPGETGTGVDLGAPLRISHRVGVDVSDVGTGISFTPATKHLHRSGDAVQALGQGVTLDRPLERAHAPGAPISPQTNTGGYRGRPTPRQWFGTLLAPRAGSIVLRDTTGAIVIDAMVYGSQQSNSSANGAITSPESAVLEGDQRQGGCIVVVPLLAGGSGVSRGRLPDGHDTDNNCTDFRVQVATSLAAPAAAGTSNLKVASVTDFVAGQTVSIAAGGELATAVIREVGTAGGTTLTVEAGPNATVLTVSSTLGFTVGQRIAIDDGDAGEVAVIAAMTRGGRFGPQGAPVRAATITVSAPLQCVHPVGALVTGSGLTLVGPLVRPYPRGAAVVDHVPTPGAPNRYGQGVR